MGNPQSPWVESCGISCTTHHISKFFYVQKTEHTLFAFPDWELQLWGFDGFLADKLGTSKVSLM